VAKIRQTLDDAGAKATLVGVDKIGGQDAYHITISVPLDLINSKIAGAAASAASTAAAGLTIDSAAVDAWVYKNDNRLAKIDLKAASSKIGNLEVIVTVTNYDKPVTITAPPASQVETTAP
jgi:2'-5' RNA ligase